MAVDQREFDELYRLEHEQHFTCERTQHEVDALVGVLKLKLSDRVLDLGCGWGRHLAELRRRGFTELVGVDVQEAFFRPLEGVTLLSGDATDLCFGAEFDAVYCAFNALFSDADSAPRVLSAVSKALKPGGRFLLDTSNRERLVQPDSPVRLWRGGGELPWLLEETRFDLLTGAQRIAQRRIFVDGRSEERTLTRFHYMLAELSRLLGAVGLALNHVYGDWQLIPYTAESPRMMLTARKEA